MPSGYAATPNSSTAGTTLAVTSPTGNGKTSPSHGDSKRPNLGAIACPGPDQAARLQVRFQPSLQPCGSRWSSGLHRSLTVTLSMLARQEPRDLPTLVTST